MKRVLILMAATALLAGSPLFADGGDSRGHGEYGTMGRGMGGEMGHHQMMGMGRHGEMEPRMMPFYDQLSAGQKVQLDALHLDTAQKMLLQQAKMQGQMLAMQQIMRSFPLDKEAARKSHTQIFDSREAMFELMLNSLAQVQQIVGKERWEQLKNTPHDQAMMRGYSGRNRHRQPGMERGKKSGRREGMHERDEDRN